MITTDRNVTLTCHVTKETKEAFREEAARRKMGMSELLSGLLEDWLVVAKDEQVEPKRSNKRHPDDEKRHLAQVGPNKDFNHIHTFNEDGKPDCGCQYADIPLPLESK